MRGRPCAIKSIQLGGATPEEQAELGAWFEREIDVLSRLRHPAICDIRDAVSEGGTQYLILEWIEGRTLAEELAARGAPGLPEPEVLRWALLLCEALTYLHQQTPPVIFRDLKPQNIMRRPDGSITLIDFGIARAITPAGGTAIGTGGYAPPEQYQGIAEVGSDVYALGATLHHLLTGRDPSGQAPFSFPRARALVPALSPQVEAALDRALSMRVGDRFPTVAAFGAALQSTPASSPVSPRPPVAVAGPVPPNPGTVQPARVASLLDLRGSSVLQDLTAQGLQRRLGFGVIRQVLPLDGGDSVIVVAGGTAALWDLRTGHVLWDIDSLAHCGALHPARELLALGSAEDIYLWDLLAGRLARRLQGHTSHVVSVAFSPDGRILASGSWDGTVRIWDVAGGRELRRLDGHRDGNDSHVVACVAFSADGRYLASGSWDKTVRVWDLATGGELRRLQQPGQVAGLAFSAGGRVLASAETHSPVARLWDVDRKRELGALGAHHVSVECLAFSPDGRLLATGDYGGVVRLWDVGRRRELHRLEGHSAPLTSVAFTAGGRGLISGSWDGTVRHWDVASGRLLRQLGGYCGAIYKVVLSPDGRLLASGHADSLIRIWDVATGQEVRRLPGDKAGSGFAFSPDVRGLVFTIAPDRLCVLDLASGNRLGEVQATGYVRGVTFSPDGRHMALANFYNTVHLFSAATWQEVRRLEGHTGHVTCVAFSPDGKTLASGSGDLSVRLWMVATGRELQRLSGHEIGVTGAAFSPDGRLLASGAYGPVRLWDVAAGRELRRLAGQHLRGVNSVAWSPDGRQIAAGAGVNLVGLWEAASGRELRSIRGHVDKVSGVSYSPDGTGLISASGDGTVRIWQV